MIKPFQYLLIGVLVLTGCSSEGIDRNRTPINSDGLFLSDGDPGAGAGGQGLGSAINTPGPSRYVQLEKLNFEATLPSIISVLFRALDQYGNALPGLQTSDFFVREDGQPVSGPETSLSVVPHSELPFTLRTVLMIDVSSSILPDDLALVKQSLRQLLQDADGRSRISPAV